MQIIISTETVQVTSRDEYVIYNLVRLILAGGPDNCVPLKWERSLVELYWLLKEAGGWSWGERLDPITERAWRIGQDLGFYLEFVR